MDRTKWRYIRCLLVLIAGLAVVQITLLSFRGLHDDKNRQKQSTDTSNWASQLGAISSTVSQVKTIKPQSEAVMLERVEELRQKCKEMSGSKRLSANIRSNTLQMFKNEKHNFSVCIVPKSGCTFMKQVLMYLKEPNPLKYKRDPGNIKDPLQRRDAIFKKSRHGVHGIASFLSPLETEEFQQSRNIKVVFARDPYRRLFSAYLDKIYVPMFWAYVRYKRLKELIRQHHNLRQIRNCRGASIPFERFLQYIIEDMESYQLANEHWLPATFLCDPCNSQPDIIIKQETYKQDMLYFLNKLQINKQDHDILVEEMGQSSKHTNSTLQGLIWTMYEGTIKINKKVEGSMCFLNKTIAHRVWSALQMQGQISQKLDFPAEELDTTGYHSSKLVIEVFMKKIAGTPITADESRDQRHQALVNAYSGVSSKIIIRLQAVYYQDFVQYGYSFDVPK